MFQNPKPFILVFSSGIKAIFSSFGSFFVWDFVEFGAFFSEKQAATKG